MFLDPDPKRRQPSMATSAFSQSRQPIPSARDLARLKREPLQGRSRYQHNEGPQVRTVGKPTVRLVDPTPSPPQTQETTMTSMSSDDDFEGRSNARQSEPRVFPGSPMSAVVRDASVSYPGFSATTRSPSVSELYTTSNEASNIDGLPSFTLVSETSTYDLPPPIWHRRSTSSGDYSQSSTLHESDLPAPKKSLILERLSSLSQLSTLRGTPSPYEKENRERAQKEGLTRVDPAETLETLQEASPERPARLSTIRAVSPSDTSSPAGRQSQSQFSDSSPSSRPRTFTSPSRFDQVSNAPARTSSKRNYSDGSIFSSPSIIHDTQDTLFNPSAANERPESPAISEGTFWQPSSPNFIAYSPETIRSVSRDPLRNAPSIDSINSRLQTGRSNDSWDTVQSHDTLPPLYVPKKRLRHKAGSASLNSNASYSREMSGMSEEDIDPFPYPKRPFSSHLSTIASESEGSRSRSASQHLSHFSLGSGVLTGDDSSSLPISPRCHQRNNSAPAQSVGTPATNSIDFDEDPGDMTLGVFREESAIPQPLFNAKPVAIDTSRKYDGPLPPIPPIPPNVESDEGDDTLTALQAPPLRQQRSGKSLRGRTMGTPNHSRQQSQISHAESDRFSNGSNLFPTWAKHFYSGRVVLTTKASFGSLSSASRRPHMHQRNGSAWTEQSITSRRGAGTDCNDESPSSSRFLPSIFRPRTRKRAGSAQRDSRSSRIRRSQRSRPSQDRSSRDSMAINPILPVGGGPEHSPDLLPSGHPRWGFLKEKHSPRNSQGQRIPSKYNKQREWDSMTFPRPMTKDGLNDFDPHLAPTKRSTQDRLSAWKAPSFNSSFDTLVTSRCNRQILCFMLGFIFPFTWMIGALLPLPKKPTSERDLEKQPDFAAVEGSEEDVRIAMMRHEAGDAERRWREERTYLKARWWRTLNRVMSVIGAFIIGAVIALVIVSTT